MADNTIRFRGTFEDHVTSSLDKLTARFTKLSSSRGFQDVVTGFGLAAGAAAWTMFADKAAAAVSEFVGGSIKAASDLNESQTKSAVIFGDSTTAIDRWAGSASKNFGQSKRQALDAASGFANLLQTAGVAVDKSAGMSENLSELGADLASFFNTDVSQALQAVQSGLIGEAEPLRRFGVLLSESRVAAEAVALGLVHSGEKLTDQVKVQARYSIILKDTSRAQGDFARTADGLANKQRSLTARMEDAQAVLGGKLLPIQLAVTDAMIEMTEAIGPAVEGISNLIAELNASSSTTGGFAEDIRQILNTFNPLQSLNLRVVKPAFEDMADSMETFTGKWHDDAEAVAKDTDELAGKFEDDIVRIPKSVEAASRAAIKVAQSTPDQIADGLFSGRDAIRTAMVALQEAITTPISQEEEIAYLKSEAVGQAIADGLASKDPVARGRAAALADHVESRLDDLQSQAFTVGDQAGDQLAEALGNKKLKAGDQAELIRIAVANSLGTLPSSAYGWGVGIDRELADGMNKYDYATTRAQKIAARVHQLLHMSTPDPSSPLAKDGGPQMWGQHLTESLSAGMVKGMGDIPIPSLGGGRLAARGQGAGAIHFTYAPTYSSASPSEAQAFARSILPELSRELKRAGVV